MVSVDGSLVVQVVNFLVLIWILNMVFYKPVREVLEKRRQKVSGLELEVEEYDQNVIERDNTYISGIKNARLSGQKKKEAILGVAVDEENRIIDKINKDAQIELEEVRDKINSEINNVRHSLESDVELFAKAIGHKILGRIV